MGVLRLLAILSTGMFLSGCIAAESPVEAHGSDNDQVAREPSSPPEAVLVDVGSDLGIAFDIDCRLGGAAALPREDGARIQSGHSKLLVSVLAPASSTGVQIGYSLDGADIVWLPTVFAEESVQEVVLPNDAAEEDGVRWTFYYSQNVKPAPQDCYTGATLFQEAIRITAT